jgi:uncharacterized protein involved in exopolysaccharide biosynthesis
VTVAPPKDPDDFELVDFEQLKNWGRFVLHAVRRRKLLALAIALLAVGATLALLSVMPRTYRIEAQLLAQKNSVMPALGNPGRPIPFDSDSPTRAAAETVMRRDNLLSVMKQTDLVNHWSRNRTWLFRLKDRLVDLIAVPTEEEKTQALVEFLENRLTVKVVEPTVTISLDWPDAQLGYRLVDTALQNFLEQRHATEVSTIAETITILEGHAAELKEVIDAEMQDFKHLPQAAPAVGAGTPASPPRRDPAAETNKAELAEVKLMLDAKRRAITELDEFRRRRLTDLQAQLAQQRAIYADAHPAIVTLQQSITSLQEPSPQLLGLRKEEHELQTEYERLSARRTEVSSTVARARSTDATLPRPGDKRVDLDADYARTRLRFDMEKYDVLLERIESARIELDTARAAFKYRYGIIRPPTFPRRPEKPKVPLILVAGVIAALALGTLAAALADLWSGKILELWQVERGLGLPVLGEVPRPGS